MTTALDQQMRAGLVPIQMTTFGRPAIWWVTPARAAEIRLDNSSVSVETCRVMKTELRCTDHSNLVHQKVFEVWHNGKFIATVTGADGPGIRIISKHELVPVPVPVASVGVPNVMEVRVVE